MGLPHGCDLGIGGLQQLAAMRAADLGGGRVAARTVGDERRRSSLGGGPPVSPRADGEQDVAELPSLIGQDVVEPVGPTGVGTPDQEVLGGEPVEAQSQN